MKRQYIKSSNESPKPPTITALVLGLALDHWHAPGWAYGVAGTIVVVLLISFFYRLINEDGVDLVDRND